MAVALTALALAAPSASAATPKRCGVPGATWARATPAQAGMDSGRLAAAVRDASAASSTAVRVYRYGCLVAEDAKSPEATSVPSESFSMAKSIVSLLFGRAWTLGFVGPDDPVGALFPEADRAHGALLLRHLATMTSGTRQSLVHDFNIALPDRIRDALTLPFVAQPGTTFNYWQSGPPLLAAAVGRAVGEDVQTFAQEELFGPLGLAPESWTWRRDAAGNTAGFWGLSMRPDDFARFGELLRRGGVWDGRRLLSERYVHDSLEPTEPNGCYGWLIWRPASSRCGGVFAGLPEGMWQFNGANGQLITVFPAQGVMTVRTGYQQDNGWAPGGPGGGRFERAFYDGVLGAITDTPVATPHVERTSSNHSRGAENGPDPFGTAVPVLPPAGPRRARAVLIGDVAAVDRHGRAAVKVRCPPATGEHARACAGSLGLGAAAGGVKVRFAVPPDATRTVQVTLARAERRRLPSTVRVRAVVRDNTRAGTVTAQPLTLRRPR